MALQLSIDQPNILRQGVDGYTYFYNLLVMRKTDKVTLKGHNFHMKMNPDRTIEVSSEGLPEKPAQGTTGTPVPTQGMNTASVAPGARREALRPGQFARLLEGVSPKDIVTGAVFDDGNTQIQLTVREGGSVYFDCQDYDMEATSVQAAAEKLTKMGARYVGQE